MTSILNAYGNWDKQKNDERIREHLPLLYRMAGRVANVTHLGTVETGDLVSAGVLGMYKAFDKFDEARGVPFGAFALPYIRGAMLDEVQKVRQIPRSMRDKQKRMRSTFDALTQQLLRTPSDGELAEHLGITESQLGEWLADMEWTTIWSVDELERTGTFDAVEEHVDNNPEANWDAVERKSSLAQALKRLDLREQQILYAYYEEELTLKEIAYVMDLSESQISRIHSKAILRLRGMMGRRKSDVL